MRLYVFITFFILGLINILEAQEILRWQDCVVEALKQHPDLISARETLNQARYSKEITQSGFLPTLTSSFSESATDSSTSSTTESYGYSLSGSQLIFDGKKTSHNVKADTESIKIAQFDYDLASANVRNRLRVAFIKLLKAQELIKITDGIAQRRRQNMELVQLRYDAGREHKGSLLTARADVSQAKLEVVQAKRNLVLAQRRLIKELGRDQFSPISVEGSLSVQDIKQGEPVFEKISEETPKLKSLVSKSKRAEFSLKAAQADFFPTLSFSSSVGTTSSKWPPNEKESWTMGLSVSFPLFEGGSRLKAVAKSRSSLNQAIADEKSGRDGAVFSLQGDWISWQDAIDNVEVKREFLEAAQERSSIAEAQYSTGLVAFDDWTVIEDNLVNFKKTFLDVQANALIAQADWIVALGGTLDDE